MSRPPDILATSFVSDGPGDASNFPSAGGSSADARVQRVYWRCIVVFFASARISNPSLDLRFYTNREPPALDGWSVRAVLEMLGVTIVIIPLTHRFRDDRSKSWGNVLYFLDILAAVEFADDAQGFVLCDCDVVVARPIAPLLERLRSVGIVGYEVGRPPAEDINGMSRADLTRFAAEFHDRPFAEPVADFGGELLAVTGAGWERARPAFDNLYRRAREGDGLAARISTEEHLFSIVFAGLPVDAVAADEGTMKRMWTSRRFNTVEPGDERYALWHLPAEKRYGLRAVYQDFRRRRFGTGMSQKDLLALASRRCGIPSPGVMKRARDLVTAARIQLSRMG